MSFKNNLIKFVSSNRNNIIIKSFHDQALNYIKAYNNVSYNSVLNGEMKVFEVIASEGCEIFFDCGANDGLDAIHYSGIGGEKMKIYAFEVVEPIYNQMVENVKNNPNIEPIKLGLGTRNETIELNYFPDHSYLSSTYRVDNTIKTEKVRGEVVVGDEFCKSKEIDKLDFLKIDVEGMDFEVIKGFENMINQNKIDVIQFEYTINFIDAKYTLKDVYDFFKEKNYSLGKIYPNGVDFEEYDYANEHYLSANYIVINNSRESLKKKLVSF